MKNAMQLKAIVKNLAKKKHVSAQLVLQNFMLERFLERVAVSKYQRNFILKGGFLIGAIVGVDSRTTIDMDATIKEMEVSEESIRKMIEEICFVELDDDVRFVFEKIGRIREDDEYGGYRVAMTAKYPPIAVPLKIDITTGDRITPSEIEYKFRLLFEDREISVLAYNLETILAEKLEAVISRGEQSTRIRDYYDIYILSKMQSENIDTKVLKEALLATAEKRNAIEIMKNHKQIMQQVRCSQVMKERWENYQKSYEYAKAILFDEVCQTIMDIMECKA